MIIEGIYEEIINTHIKNNLSIIGFDDYEIGKEALDVEEARKILSTYISTITRRALKYIRDEETENKAALLNQIKICNEIIELLSEKLDEEEFRALKIEKEGEILTYIYPKINTARSIKKQKIIRPITPISQSTLFTGSHYEPNMLGELKKEIVTSDSIDMLVSFIKWSGLRCTIEELREFTEKNEGKLRIITTSYMEATDYKAIEELSKLKNTEIKISYDVNRTRLHAKAYMFKRETGFTTAYIGSSNLSNPAITSGLEWNVKVTEKDSFDIIKKFEATFESYWNDNEFVYFNRNKEEDKKRLQNALNAKKNKEDKEIIFNFDIQPYHYQKEILEKLQVERKVFGRTKNLLVAATGVGKTVISAFDYKRFQKENGNSAKLLFVAHREEILKQSLNTFRGILKDFNFGDLLVGGNTPKSLDHLFTSIQSFNSTKLYEKTTTDFYDFIIVDEFHHAPAASYQPLLNYYKPKILLGLTATPERMDGEDVLKYFDHTIAAEMRLNEAIDRKLLCPFQYFCVSDTVDLSKLKWSRKGYDIKELENVYTSNTIRSNQIINSIKKYVTDIDEIKGLGFCVSIEHAKYMADFFNKSNIPSIALFSGVDKEIRDKARIKLVEGDIKFIFVVDLYNEGVDIPEINTEKLIRFIIDYLEGKREVSTEEDKLMLNMLYYSFYNSEPMKEGFSSIEEGIEKLKETVLIKEEIIDILSFNYKSMDLLNIDNDFKFPCPLDVHCSYTTNQIMAALGYFNKDKSPAFREGVKYFEDKKLDIFFITLNKSEKGFSPSTLYEDYAINDTLFHWQSQSNTSVPSKTGQRYINHIKTGNRIALFVRESKKYNGYTSPFIFLGSCEYVSHSGDRPINFVYRLKEEMPPNLVPIANKNIS